MIARATGWGNLALIVFVLLTVADAPAHGTPDTLTADRLQKHVYYLADDVRSGRDAGSAGCAAAESYIADHFEEFGLAPPPQSDDFFMAFNLYRSGYDLARSQLVVGSTRGRLGSDFRPFPFSAENDVALKVVFAGYGVTAPEYDYDDYTDLDVEDRIVLVLRREPNADDSTSVFDGAENTDHATFRRKATTARERGARALLVVTDPAHPSPVDDFRAAGRLRVADASTDGAAGDGPEGDDETDEIVAVHISREIGYRLVEELTGLTAVEVQRRLDGGELVPSELEPRDVFVRVAVHELEEPELVYTRNVAAVLEGSDPELKHELVVVGAHHDHVGAFEGIGDTVFNGADDNASGTAAIIELARAFAANAVPPRRSVVFATFSAEERGLLGSSVMVEQNQIPIDDTVFMLNLDMIGRNPDESLEISGDGVARGSYDLVVDANRGLGLDLNFLGKFVPRNTDHTAFYDAGIPFITFFSGYHDDYHQVSDHADKLDYDRMATIARLAYEIVIAVANVDVVPSVIHAANWLGIEFEEIDGPTVVAVEAESRAAKAGIRLHDRLAKVDGKKVQSAREANDRLRETEPGTATTVSVRRDDELVTFDVARAYRGFLGINPRPLSDERRAKLGLSNEEGVLVAGLVPGGPCETGGMKTGDIIVSLDGRPVTPTRLSPLLSQIGAGETVDIHLIRDGDRMNVSVTLGERRRR